jgi:hypothetical protein
MWTAYIQYKVILMLGTVKKLMTSQPLCISYLSVALTLPFTFVKRLLVYSGSMKQRQAKIILETMGTNWQIEMAVQ